MRDLIMLEAYHHSYDDEKVGHKICLCLHAGRYSLYISTLPCGSVTSLMLSITPKQALHITISGGLVSCD